MILLVIDINHKKTLEGNRHEDEPNIGSSEKGLLFVELS